MDDPLRAAAQRVREGTPWPPGVWVSLEADSVFCIELTVGPSGPVRIARHDAPALLRQVGDRDQLLFDQLTMAVTALLVRWAMTSPDRTARFSLAELGAALGQPRLSGADAERFRAAIRVAAMPAIHRRTLELQPHLGPPIESVDGLFRWPPLIALRSGRPGGRPRPNEVRLHPTVIDVIRAGAFLAVEPTTILAAPGRLTAALWFMSPLLTLHPADADGVVRTRLTRDALIALLGSGDRSHKRVRRAIGAAVAELSKRDGRFAGSYTTTGTSQDVVLVRTRSLEIASG